jgi:hypothetical protein
MFMIYVPINTLQLKEGRWRVRTGIPAWCSRSTACFGGTPMAQTNSEVFSSMMTSISSPSFPFV